jgi:hypothetical protein
MPGKLRTKYAEPELVQSPAHNFHFRRGSGKTVNEQKARASAREKRSQSFKLMHFYMAF